MPPFSPPVQVAVAAPTADPPELLLTGAYAAEPKVDGWRGVLFTRAGVLHSRTGNHLQRWFPEIPADAADLGDLVLDGEIVALREGRPAFGALQGRSRGLRRGEDFTVHYAAFDLLAAGRTDWRSRPYRARRAELARRLDGAPPRLSVIPSTTDPQEARVWWDVLVVGGQAEGLMYKPSAAPYKAGRASGWLKTRRTETRELVVVGVAAAGRFGAALILAAPGSAGGRLRPVAVSMPIPEDAHRELGTRLRPAGPERELPGTVGGLPGAPAIRYQPVQPDVVVEVTADPAVEWGRFRHRPRWIRVRDDVAPADVPPIT